MTLEGEPDPNFDSSISPDNPLEQLERLFAQFKYGEFEKHVCRPSTREDENKNLHFHLDCDLHSDSPCKGNTTKLAIVRFNDAANDNFKFQRRCVGISCDILIRTVGWEK